MIAFPHIVGAAASFKMSDLPPGFPMPEGVANCQYPSCVMGTLATNFTYFVLKSQPSVARVFYSCQAHYQEAHRVVHESGLAISDNKNAVASGTIRRLPYAR